MSATRYELLREPSSARMILFVCCDCPRDMCVVERSSTPYKSRDSCIIVGGNAIIWVVSTATVYWITHKGSEYSGALVFFFFSSAFVINDTWEKTASINMPPQKASSRYNVRLTGTMMPPGVVVPVGKWSGKSITCELSIFNLRSEFDSLAGSFRR